MKLDEVLTHIGELGRYQMFIAFIIMIMSMAVTWFPNAEVGLKYF